MRLSYRYRAYPTTEQVEELERQFDIHRQVYNRALDVLDEHDDWVSEYDMYGELTDWKSEESNDFDDANARSLQESIGRIYDAISSLSTKKERGKSVGRIRHRPSGSWNSIEYVQSGFGFDEDSIRLHPVGHIDVTKHRELPDNADVKGVTIKRQQSGDWYCCVIADVQCSDRVALDTVDDENVVGIDFNVSNLLTDTDERVFEPLHDFLSDEIERVNLRQQVLSRKKYGSNNYEKQRRKLAQAYEDLVNKRDDVLHKLSRWYVDTYDLIAVEDIDSKQLSEGPVSYIREQAWGRFTEFCRYKAQKAGVWLREIDPAYTTQECSNCGTKTEKALDERTHDCPSCECRLDRDVNAARNVRDRALDDIGRGPSEYTPPDRQTADGTIPLRRLAERGSPRL